METIYKLSRLSVLLLALCMQPLQTLAHDPLSNERVYSISVILADAETGETIPFANMVVYDLAARQLTVGTTNLEGFVTLRVPAKKAWILKALSVGYSPAIDTIIRNDSTEQYRLVLQMADDGIIICGTRCGWSVVQAASDEEILEAGRAIELAELRTEVVEDLNDFECFPNPVREDLNVNVWGIEAVELLIINAAGQVLVREKVSDDEFQFNISMRNFPAGHYYVLCRGAGYSSNSRTIIRQE